MKKITLITILFLNLSMSQAISKNDLYYKIDLFRIIENNN